MGRNSGSNIVWTYTNDSDPKYALTWYCQQHAKYDHLQNPTLATAFATLKTHLETEHGNVEQ